MHGKVSSRERTLAAIKHQEPDRVPINFRRVAPLNHLWKDEYERVSTLLETGTDDKLTVSIEPRIHPDVTVRDWFDDQSVPEYRLAYREYRTPKGVIRIVMRATEDCTYKDGVPLASDHNRKFRPPLKYSPADRSRYSKCCTLFPWWR
ncbi:MAG TPA: hypothetical protein EYP53_09990 [Candidatus Latescibacteria bacterium]|nr:hypothetical protein [Candidatus Latescibacterota bacterium]